VVALAFLALGYAASQYYYFVGDASGFAARMDATPIRALATLILLAAVALSFLSERDPEGEN